MKSKNILFSLSILLGFILMLNFASATVTVNYNISSAIIENDGVRNVTGSVPVSGVYVDGYICNDVACATVGAQVPGLTSYTAGSVMSVVYPDNLPASGRYVLYFHKDGYIGWEQIANYNSPDAGTYTLDSSQIIYMAKKRSGSAPIMNLSVTDSVPQNTPIRVGLNVSIDADTYSAIERHTASNVPLNETVATFVSVAITNSSGTIVYSANQTVNIPYSSYLPVNFDFVPGFSQTGVYGVAVVTSVIDAKLLSSASQTASSGFSVIPQGLANYTYTSITNSQYSPALPRVNDTMTFTFGYLSQYIDQFGVNFPANTNATIAITRNGNNIYNSTVNLGSTGTYSFTQVFNETGNYVLTINGFTTDGRGNQTFAGSQVLTFTVNSALGNATEYDDTPTHHDTTKKNSTVITKPLIDSEPLTGDAIVDLTSGKSKNTFVGSFLFWVVLLVILLLIAVITTYVVKYVF